MIASDDFLDERAVNLDLVDGQTLEVAEAGKTGAEIIKSNAPPNALSRCNVSIACSALCNRSDSVISSSNWQHYIPLIERKSGALRNGAPFDDLPNPLRLLKRGLRRHSNGDRVMTQVLVAVELESGSLSADHILNVLARLTATSPPLTVETSLQLKVAPVANTARYDQLRTTDEESRNA